MRRAHFLTLMVFFPCFPGAWANPIPLAGALPPSNAQIGIVAAVHGTVNIGSGGAVGKVAESGMPVYLGDEVSTGVEGTLQILLLDETVFKIGPNSAIVIDKFVYDPTNDTGEVKARVVKGVFRFVTGKIARKKPSSMQVDLPAGTIGIRGTIVAGETGAEGRSMVVLLGPGEKSNTGSRTGKITVGNETAKGKKEVVVNKTGFGTRIEGPGEAPLPAFEIPKEDLERISGALGAAPGGGGKEEGEEGGTATEESGEDQAECAESIEAFSDVQALGENADEESGKASQQNAKEINQIKDGISTYDDLRRIETGQFHYTQTNVPLFFSGSQDGFYTVKFDINFGARKVGGGNSQWILTANSVVNPASVNLTSVSFASGSQNAIFSYTDGTLTGSGCSTNCTATIKMTLNNSGGVPAATATNNVTLVAPGASKTFTGSSTTSRLDGLS